jgi:hypothetical protein
MILRPSQTHQDSIALGGMVLAVVLASGLAIIRLIMYQRGPVQFWNIYLIVPFISIKSKSLAP